MSIKKAAVIGAGVMGSGIAAHIANAGIPVVLLDIVSTGAENRSAIAEGAVARLKKTDPAPLMHERNAKLITPGNLEDHLGLLADADLIIEAVLEDPVVKRALYAKVESVRKDGSIVASNTSTIPLKILTEGLGDRFEADFLITHFFNPPRYMRLLEIVSSPKTRPDAVTLVEAFCDRQLGKGVVHCKDTPGFIANRIGTFWIQLAINGTLDFGLTVEEADAIMGRPFGIPKTGIFGLIDLVGLDLMPHVSKSLQQTLLATDAFQAAYRTPELFTRMIADGLTGRKGGKGGFYRINRAAGKRKESMDLATGTYRPEIKCTLESAGLKHPAAVMAHGDRGGRMARYAMGATLAYAASLVPEITDTIVGVDDGMKLGYNWKDGPFELIDKIGVDRFIAFLDAEKIPVPPLVALAKGRSFYTVEAGRLHYLTLDGSYKPVERADGVLLLEDVKRAAKPLLKNASASLWDLGDGVACLEFHSKMNAIDPEIMALIGKSIAHVSKGMKGLVVYNEGSNFSVGANLGIAMFAANIGLWPALEESVATGQATYKALKFAPFPVVAAPFGMALGGGCEVCLHADAVQAHAELYTGLVEVGVGLLPGWGGCKELLLRTAEAQAANKRSPQGPMPVVGKVFETISTAQVSRSAEQARDLGFLRPTDGITMNRDRLLFDAKAKVLALAEGYQAPEPKVIRLPGPTAATAFTMAVADFARQGKATPHDQTVAAAVAGVVSGGDTDMLVELTEDQLSELERHYFMGLVRQPATLARIEHMLETGKPLRN